MRKILFHLIGYTLVAAGFFWAGALTRDYFVKKATAERRARPAKFLNIPAPKLTSLNLDGATWTLDQLSGKVVVLEVWATWCAPCVSSIPSVKRLHDRFKERSDFALIGVSLDDDAATTRQFCVKHEMSWLQLLEPKKGWDNSIAQSLEVKAVPFLCVIDKKGTVRVYDYYAGSLEILIEKLLNEPSQP